MEELDLRISKVLVVGGGNASHVLVARCGHLGIPCDWLTTFEGEADKLKAALKASNGVIATDHQTGEKWFGRPERVSGDPADVVPGAKLIILTLPAFAQEPTLKRIGPHVSPDSSIGAIPGGAAIDVVMNNALGVEKVNACTLFGTRTLPWACRIEDYGKRVTVFGTKESDQIVVRPKGKKFMVAALQEIVGHKQKYILANNFLFLSFTMPWHPCFMYGMFKEWDGKTPFMQVPPFYRSISQFTAELLSHTSDEVMKLRNKITELYPSIDLSDVIHVKEWVRRAYGTSMPSTDPNDLRAMIAKNPTYGESLLFPMKKVKGGYVPDFTSRYLTEDVPYMLVVHKGLAEMVGVSMPKIDMLLKWCQKVMEKEYLVGGKLKGRDIGESRAPQRFGYHDFETFAKAMRYI